MLDHLNTDDTDDLDDEVPEIDHSADDAPESPLLESAAQALATVAYEGALTHENRKALRRQPGVIIVKVPDASWAPIIGQEIRHMDCAPVIRTVTERLKQGGALHRVGGEELKYLQHGRVVLYVCHDPEELIDETALAAADILITIPSLTPAQLRKVIRRVTGGVARGVSDAMAGLDPMVIISAVRRELTARQCVGNLRRALERIPEPVVSSVPPLSELPLTASMRSWADRTLADLIAVRNRTLSPDQLLYGVLEGPPGTGKSMIAESLARSAGWSFVPTNVGDLFTTGDGALGGVARNLKGFIDELLSCEPSIGFMDEIESFPNRATMDNRGRDWWTPVVTLFLTEIDRLRKSGRRILLLGATNYYHLLDSALVRSGRLQQRIRVLPPSTCDEVTALLRYHLKDDLVDVDLDRLALIGRGATPAMVEGWLKEARSAARAHDRPLELADILARMVPDDDRTPEDIRAIAIHESGHAVVAHRLGRTVESVSIIPEGPSGGRTITRLSTMVSTWRYLCDTVAIALGGRAADIVLGNGPNVGAEGDLAHATTLLLDACERQGLRDSLVFAPAIGVSLPGTRRVVSAELRRQLARAIAIVETDRDLVLDLADRLIEERVITGEEAKKLLGPRSVLPPAWFGGRPQAGGSLTMRPALPPSSSRE